MAIDWSPTVGTKDIPDWLVSSVDPFNTESEEKEEPAPSEPAPSPLPELPTQEVPALKKENTSTETAAQN